MNENAKIILVDDNALFRESLKFLIEMEGMGEVVAEAENGQVFLNLLEIFNPDLVILDIKMPVIGGLEATLKAIAKRPDLKILILTMTFGKENCDTLRNAGVMGFILKTEGKQVLERAIKTMIEGKSYFPEHHL
jgi:DNA-binding NarL/FixJ family response regulator